MSPRLLQFSQFVPAAGYSWTEARPIIRGLRVRKRPEWFLVRAGGSWLEHRQGKVYDPFRTETGLFRNLADLEPTQESIVAFANRYGELGENDWGLPLEYRRARVKAPPDTSLDEIRLRRSVPESIVPVLKQLEHEGGLVGDPLSVWRADIREMRDSVELLELIETKKSNAVAKLFRVTGTAARYLGPAAQGPIIVQASKSLQGSAAIGAGLAVLHARIKQRLTRRLTPRLSFDESTNRSDLAFAPERLRDVLWLQLAEAMCYNRRYRQCDVCAKWYEVAPDVARTSRMYCSTACKLKAYRARQKTARDLRRDGRPLREIAKLVSADMSTVKGWVKDV
ncbi:MAG: hypothetical protein MI757_05190 [Pirellulales bacterium]|nr:hypothetical protein [Pirellulales bacterium]